MNGRTTHKTTVLVWLAAALSTMCEIASADFYFGKPQSLGPTVNSPSGDASPCLSPDGLESYFVSGRLGGSGAADIWVSTRQSVNDPWGPPANLGPTVNSPYNDNYPSLSLDGLTLYFSDGYSGTPRPGGLGAGDIWMTTRPSRSAPWGTPVNLGAPINGSTADFSPSISGDGLTLVFTSNNRAGGSGSWDLWMSTRAAVQDPWGPPLNLGPTVNTGTWEGEGGLSWDGRAVFFDSGRTGIAGAIDLWISTRKTLADPWGVAVNLGRVVNSSGNDGTARVSPDMRTLYFCSDRPGGFGDYDLYQAPILPVVDFNGDGNVDIKDLVRLIESWGQDDPAVDVGPAPWGDGTVDAADLEVLMSYWGQEILSPALIAYWKLDEKEGVTATDSVGENDATVLGDALWQPDAGQIRGALELDGLNDCLALGAVVNPGAGPFSVFAWVQGGAPGQVILSQADGANWLRAAPGTGTLQTELNQPGRNAGKDLPSAAVITDGVWHRVGLVWDGINRTLYVDEVAVASGTLSGLPSSLNGLYLGADGRLTPGRFWSGQIDDVRIYNQALQLTAN